MNEEKKEAIYQSGQDYLEAVLMLLEDKGYCKSVDIAQTLGFSKPSVSIAMKKLREQGFIVMGENGLINLTEKGYMIAASTYERHKVLGSFFVSLGVDEKTAYEDACKIEHVISQETFEAIKKSKK